jgi:hypothetical protein
MSTAGAVQRQSSDLTRESGLERYSKLRASSLGKVDELYKELDDESVRGSDISMTADAIRRNFIIMSVCFSANHGCVTTASGFAAADFPTAGNDSNSALYLMYCLSAMLLSGVVIALWGSKFGMIAGLFQYTVYICTFFLALVADAPALIIAGGAFGGMGSGYLWVCQGSYFTDSAKLSAAETGEPLENVTGEFASLFATIFLSLELGSKLLAYGVKAALPEKGSMVLYIAFTAVCLASVLGMYSAKDLRSSAEQEKTPITQELILGKSIAAGRLLLTDSKMSLMVPTQLAFATIATFLGSFVTPFITNKAIGNSYVALFLGVIAGVAAITSFFAGRFIKSTGLKWPMMTLGAVAFACVSLPFLFNTNVDSYAQTGKVLLVYIAQGVGRGIYESTNKAVIAGFFPNDAPAAFANVIWTNGLMSAVLYLAFDKLCTPTPPIIDEGGAKLAALITLGMIITGIVCYFFALAKFNTERSDPNNERYDGSSLGNSNSLTEPLRDSISNL